MAIIYYLQMNETINDNKMTLIKALRDVQELGLKEAKEVIDFMQENGIKDILKPDKTRWEFTTQSEAEEKKIVWNQRLSEDPNGQVTVKQEGQEQIEDEPQTYESLIEEEEQLIESLERIRTAGIFPSIYEGFREIDELANAEDAIAEILKQCIKTLLNDRRIETASNGKISEWEDATGTEPEGTIEQRREAVRAALARDYAFNDIELKALVDKLAGEDVLNILIDYVKQEITLYQTANSDSETDAGNIRGALPTRIAHEILPAIPQALRCYGETRNEQTKSLIINHGKSTTIYAKAEGGV